MAELETNLNQDADSSIVKEFIDKAKPEIPGADSSIEKMSRDEKKAIENPTPPESTMDIPAEPEPEVLTGLPLNLMLLGITFAAFVYALDITIIVTAIPVITTHFHTIDDIGWYGSAYFTTLCATAPLAGKLYQFYDLKYTFFTFIVIFEIGSVICGAAPTSTALIIGRAIAGIGGGGILGGGFTIIAVAAPKERRTKLLALVYVSSQLGTLLAPILGGVFTEKASWRWCFYINLPVGAITLAFMAFIRIPDNRPTRNTKPSFKESVDRLDPIGFALFAPTCIMILLAQWGGTIYAWSSSVIIGLFVGFTATLALFILWEGRRGDDAIVPFSIIRRRVIWTSCLVMTNQYGSMNIVLYYLPIWFQAILGANPIQSGVYILATAVPTILSNLIIGILAAKLGTPTIFTILGNGIAVIGTGLLTTLHPTTGTGVWLGYQILTGFGRGMTLQQPLAAVQATLTPATMSVGTSSLLFCQYFGGAVYLALAQTDFSSSLRSALRQYRVDIDVDFLSEVGASGIRENVTSEQLPGVLLSYNEGIRNALYLAVGATGAAFLCAFGMGFTNIKKKPESPVAKNTPADPAEV